MSNPTHIVVFLLKLTCIGLHSVNGIEVVDISCPPGYTVRGQAAYTKYHHNNKDVSNNFLLCIICEAESYTRESLDVCMARDVFKSPKFEEAAAGDDASYLRAAFSDYTYRAPYTNANAWLEREDPTNLFTLARMNTGSDGDIKAAICGLTYTSALNSSLSDLAGLGQIKYCQKSPVAPSIKVLNTVVCPDPKMRLGGILYHRVTGSCGLCYSSSSGGSSSRNPVYICRRNVEGLKVNVYDLYYRCLAEPCEKDFALPGNNSGNNVGSDLYCGFELDSFGRENKVGDVIPGTSIVSCADIITRGYFGLVGGGMEVLNYVVIFAVSLCVVLVIVLVVILFRMRRDRRNRDKEKTVDEYVVQNVYYE